MPYKSEAQCKFFNSPEGKRKLGEKEVEHWNEVSEGKKLPDKKDSKDLESLAAIDKAIRVIDAAKEGPDSDAEIKKLVQEQIQLLSKVETTIKKLKGYEKKFAKYKWAGSQVSYTRSAVNELESGVDGAMMNLKRSLDSI